MSGLKDQLQNDLKDAMKQKDNFKRDAIRFLMSALKQIEVDERKELSDADIIKIIQKSLKQREDASTAFKEAQRDDLYEKEKSSDLEHSNPLFCFYHDRLFVFCTNCDSFRRKSTTRRKQSGKRIQLYLLSET